MSIQIKKVLTRQNFYWLIFITVFLITSLEIFGKLYLTYFLEKSADRKFQFDSYRIFAHRPNFREGDGKKDWIVINSQGFRRTSDVSKSKPANTFRVFLLGGSAAHGSSSAPPYPIRHVYNNETIDACLEKMLSEKHSNVHFEVINVAVSAYQVFQHTQYIISELLDYNPDLMIFLDGANDHYTDNPDFNIMSDNRYQFWKPRLQSPSIAGQFEYFMLWLSKYSNFARGYCAWRTQNDAFNSNKIKDLNGPPLITNDVERIKRHKLAAPKQFLRNININLLILRDYKIDALLCLQPMLSERNINILSPEEKNFNAGAESIHMALYPVIVEELKEISTKFNVPFIDMIPVVNDSSFKGKQFFIDYAHYTPEGSLLIAKAMLPEVENFLKKKFPF